MSNLLPALAVVVFLAGCATGTIAGVAVAMLVSAGITMIATVL